MASTFTTEELTSCWFVTVMALPEPATFVFVGIGAGLAALAFRRRGRAF
jgi:hypothetical protein